MRSSVKNQTKGQEVKTASDPMQRVRIGEVTRLLTPSEIRSLDNYRATERECLNAAIQTGSDREIAIARTAFDNRGHAWLRNRLLA